MERRTGLLILLVCTLLGGAVAGLTLIERPPRPAQTEPTGPSEPREQAAAAVAADVVSAPAVAAAHPASDPDASPGAVRAMQDAIAAREYRSSGNDHGLQAPNRRQGFRTYFEPTGIRVAERAGSGRELLGLRWQALGRNESLAAVPPGEVVAAGSRVEIRRDGLTEWFENAPGGLEQGFTIASRSDGEGPLLLDLALEGAEASLRDDGLEIESATGKSLRYAKLAVEDAAGRTLVARLTAPSANQIRIEVEDAGASYPLVIDPLLTAASDTTLQSNHEDASFGITVASAGDVNADGYGDVIVGTQFYDAGEGDGEGAAFVFLGSASGVADANPATAHAQLEGNQANGAFGRSVASAGDVNGDGYDDVIVGAQSYTSGQAFEGAAFVFHGSASGIGNGNPSTADAQLESNQEGSDFGESVDGAGDVNGDGYADVIVGARSYDAGDGFLEGAAWIFLGSGSGISSGNPGTADAQLEANQIPARFGRSVAGAGDVNGDGYDDVIVGASSFDSGAGNNEGAAFAFLGSASGIANGNPGNAHAVFISLQTPANLGASVAGAGDVNGDGYADVIVGAANYNAGQDSEGAAFVFLGSASGLSSGNPSTADAQLESNEDNAQFGNSVAGAGDVNGDGYADVIVGSRLYDSYGSNEGAAFVFLGSATGIADGNPTTAFVQLDVNQLNAQYGYFVAGAGDVNGDGYADVIVGVKDYDAPQSDEGAAFVYHGGASGITAAGNPANSNSLLEGDQLGAQLGFSVAGAGDVDGDGYQDVIVGASGYDAGQGQDEGAAFVFLGSASGVVVSGNPGNADSQLEANQANAHFGHSVAGAGDVNGDGYADVIVGAYGYDAGEGADEGAAFVFLGSGSGIVGAGNPLNAHSQLESNLANAFFGESVAGAGDVNGDGYADVLVGAGGYDAGQGLNEGAAFVFLGSGSGIVATGNPSNADSQLESDQAGSFFGRAVAGAGDVNGDGFADVIVGAYFFDAGQGSGEGAAFVFQGSAAGVVPSGNPGNADSQLESDQPGGALGLGVAGAGDVNGDGYADVLVGAYGYDAGQGANEGAAFVFLGGQGGLVPSGNPGNADSQLESDQAGSFFGRAVAGAGDVNGDGYADVIVGADSYDSGQGFGEGAAFVFHGSPAGIAPVGNPINAEAVFESNQAGANLGWSVAGAGDVNGDGYADVIVGALAYDAGQGPFEGAGFVFQGNGGADGRPVLAGQRRADLVTPVQSWGSSESPEFFAVSLRATHPAGRARAKLEIQSCEPGFTFFVEEKCTSVVSAAWTDTTATPGGVTLTELVDIDFGDLSKRWRARVLYAPFHVTELGITAPPKPGHGPWRRLSGQAFEGDVHRQMVDSVFLSASGQAFSVLGGLETWGGIEGVFPPFSSDADLDVVFQPAAIDARLQDLLPDPTAIDFTLGMDPVESWQIDFAPTLGADPTLTFQYSDADLLVPEASLQVWHYDGGTWSALPVSSRDTAADTITVTTSSFSPFVIGGPASKSIGWSISGAALGGTIQFTIGAVFVSVTTTNGQTAEQVGAAIAAAINGDPALSGAGISASSNGSVVTTDGAITSTSLADAGLAFFAIGDIDVYPSALDDGFASAPVEIRGGHALVHVWFNGGYLGPTGPPCTGTGQDEICGWKVRLETTGNLVIVDVAWNELVSQTVLAPIPPQPVTTIEGEAGTGGFHVGPTKIATVAVAGTDGELQLSTPTVSDGFIGSDGVTFTQVATTTLARTPYLPWSGLSANQGLSTSACGVLGNGELRCRGVGAQVGIEPFGAYRQVANATGAACALDFAGAVSCWGTVAVPPSSTYLQLAGGDGHFCGLTPLLDVECWDGAGTIGAPPAGPFRMVSRGAGHACALRLDSTVACWGLDADGQATPLSGTFIDLAGGVDHTCALAPDGSAECWGDNSHGEAPALVVGLRPFVEISAGSNHTCAIRDDASLECWGDTSSGQGAIAGSFVSLSSGEGMNCGIRSGGGSICWGTGAPPGPDTYPFPQPATGTFHSCQIKADTDVECWGDDSFGQVTQTVTGFPGWTGLDGGDSFTCGNVPFPTASDRFVFCWGDSSSGQLTVPGGGWGSQSLGSAGGYGRVAAGDQHACGILHDGSVECWGDNTFGQASGAPGAALLEVVSGDDFACGLRTNDRGISCWGSDTGGPVTGAPVATGFRDITAGGRHACALDPAGGITCWGEDNFGQATPPAGTFADVRAGGSFTCALRDDDTSVCWGFADEAISAEPSVPLVRAYQALASGGRHVANANQAAGFVCGTAAEGGLVCWGADSSAQSRPPFELEPVGDGVEDSADNCPEHDNGPLAGTCTAGTVGFGCYAHSDCDPAGYCSRFQEDGDFDGVGDVCDNCLGEQNPQQFDRDSDGIGDDCDPQPDGEPAQIQVGPPPGGGAGAGAGVSAAGFGGGVSTAGATNTYEVRLTCPAAVQIGRIQFGLILPPEAVAENAVFGGSPGCSEPASGGCTAASNMGPTVDKANSFIVRGADVVGADPNTIFFSLVGLPVGNGQLPNLCDLAPLEILAVVEVAAISASQPPSLSQSDSMLASADLGGLCVGGSRGGLPCDFDIDCPDTNECDLFYDDDPPEPVLDPDGNSVAGTNWAYVAGDGSAAVKVLVSPAIVPNNDQDWVLKLEAPLEIKRIKIGFEDTIGSYQIPGCEGVNCCPGNCALDVCDEANPMLGPSVNLCRSHAEYSAERKTYYVVLEGDLNASLFLDHTLLHIPNQAPSRVTLGVLRSSQPGIEPGFKLEQIEQVLPLGPAFVVPGNTAYMPPVDLTGSGEVSEDVDGDLISNDTDNCVVRYNDSQADGGGLHVATQQAPPFDGVGDGCQCGDVMGDGQITGPGFPSGGDLGDVAELQAVLAGDPAVSEADEQAALARCSVSGVVAVPGTGNAYDCNIKDLLTLALAIDGKGPGVSAVCSRNTRGQPLDQ